MTDEPELALSVLAEGSDAMACRPGLVQYFRRRSRDPCEVEDMVQEVYLRIASRRTTDVVENVFGQPQSPIPSVTRYPTMFG